MTLNTMKRFAFMISITAAMMISCGQNTEKKAENQVEAETAETTIKDTNENKTITNNITFHKVGDTVTYNGRTMAYNFDRS